MIIIRKIFILIASAALTATIWAQSPQKFSYQAIIRDATDHLVTTHGVGIKISILQTTSTGTAVYEETQTTTTNANGLITIEIGGGTPVTGTFASIDWSAGPYFIKIQTDPAGGTAYSITGTSQLLSVPYALFAKAAGGHFVGELYGGGIVVSVWKNAGVEHGLIASLTDINAAAPWSDVTTLAGAFSGIDGQANTAAIISHQTTTSAAQLCKSYSGGGFNDWYLPASWELKECYDADYVVNSVLGATNGFKYAIYWSSTESTATNAWYLGFDTGTTGSDALKSLAARVRAVRRF